MPFIVQRIGSSSGEWAEIVGGPCATEDKARDMMREIARPEDGWTPVNGRSFVRSADGVEERLSLKEVSER
ncbi:hypothetical protein [Terrarubrum flagellatum]|uniref:hypothetical protein n=1 Tax=Terrirubrum flagellatum TaxID=2895980 RepID=UPI0031456E13